MGGSNTNKDKVKVFITVDTEDTYFDMPRLITGEGIEGSPGVGMIMDILDKYNCKANFFLNVYEHINYKEGALRDITINISDRGHEVELHTHPNEKLDFYKRPIYNYDLERQVEILEYGKKLIYDWIGESPVAHRGGAYSCNDDTLKALDKVGIPIDSSYWLNNPKNLFIEKFTVNRAVKVNNTIEIPVTYVDYIKSNGMHKDSKLDINWLNESELIEVIEQAKQSRLRFLILFLHSFSFLRKIKKDICEASDPEALFVSKPSDGKTYVQINGVDKAMIKTFGKVIEYISSDADLEVCTFKEYYQAGFTLEDSGEDFIPVINRCK